MQRLPQLGVLPHAVAVAANRNQVAMVDQSIDEGGGHDVVTEDLAPFLKAFVGRQDRLRMLVMTCHELEEQHRAGARDR